jgi:hypothetical protein
VDLDSTYEVTGRVFVSFLLLIITFFFYQRSLSGWTDWAQIFAPVQPALQADPSPSDRLNIGTIGCLSFLFYRVLMFLTIAGAIDILFLGGNGILLFVWTHLPQWTAILFDTLGDILRRISS